MQLHKIDTPGELERWQPAPGLPPFDRNELIRNLPDEHWALTQDSLLLAHCSLWWRNTPRYNEMPTGVIGHYNAANLEAASRLLRHACDCLRDQGCGFALGPMDGNTWHRYRLVTDAGDEPPFFLEPDTPAAWIMHWQDAGFEPVAHYSSHINTALDFEDRRLERVALRMQEQGVSIHAMIKDEYETVLRQIYRLSCISFQGNFLYTPIAEEKFISMYSRLRPYIHPELVLLAMQDGELVGFLFALPDLLQAQRGHPVDTVIIKTVAVLPGRVYAGLGNLLAARCHRASRELGYTRAIHALMHDSNHSRNVSSHYAHVMRRYALFGRPLNA